MYFRIYAIDVLGDTNLREPVKSFDQDEDIDKWMCEVIHELGIEKTSIIGYSAGGYCTLKFVIHARHRINKVLLLAPAACFIPFHKQFFIRLALINLIRKRAFIDIFILQMADNEKGDL